MNIDTRDINNEEIDNVIDNVETQDENIPEIIKQDNNPQGFEKDNMSEINTEAETEEVKAEETGEEEANAETEPEIDYKAEYEKALEDNEKLKIRHSDSSRENSLNQIKIKSLEERIDKITSSEIPEEELIEQAKKLFPAMKSWETMTEAEKETAKSYVEATHYFRKEKLEKELEKAKKIAELQMEKVKLTHPIVADNENDFAKFVTEKDPQGLIQDLSVLADAYELKKLKQANKPKKQIQKNALMRTTSVQEEQKPKLDQDAIKRLRESNTGKWEEYILKGKI